MGRGLGTQVTVQPGSFWAVVRGLHHWLVPILLGAATGLQDQAGAVALPPSAHCEGWLLMPPSTQAWGPG